MKRIFVILLLLFSLIPLFSKEYLYDNANLLSQSEKESLSSLLEIVSENTGVNTVIVTYSSTSYSSMDTADAVIEKEEYNSNGVCFAMNMAQRDYYISTLGKAVYYLDDYALSDSNLDNVLFPYLSDGDYYTAFSNWAEYVEYCCDYEDETGTEGDNFEWGISLFFSLSLASFISLMIVLRGKRKLKNIAPQNSADDYIVPDSFVLTRNKDIYLYSNVVRVRRPNNDGNRPPGGPHHSTMHTSSSGMSHGGRGGRF